MRLVPDSSASKAVSEQSSGLVIFDGDDTLWKTQEIYERVKLAFAGLLRECSFSTKEVMAKLDEIDCERVDSMGFSVGRFVESMRLTYTLLCQLKNKAQRADIDRLIESIAVPLFGPPELYEDALCSLAKLRQHYKLVLATKGEESAQQRKIECLGLRSYFHVIYVLRQKAGNDYLRIMSDMGEVTTRSWVVGNSVRSDVNPALRVGLRAILIPRGAWLYEKENLLEGDITIVGSLAEAALAMAARDGVTL